MSEPPVQPPPTPESREPFGSAPIQPTGSAGCGKPVLIGCGSLLVIFGFVAILFLVKAKDILIWAFDQMEQGIVEKLPEDVTAEERARLERAFDAAARAAVSGKSDTLGLQQLQSELMSFSAKVDRMTREDVLSLILALESFAGIEAEQEPPPEALPPPEETVDSELTAV